MQGLRRLWRRRRISLRTSTDVSEARDYNRHARAPGPYPIPVRQTRSLPPASFSLNLTVHTLTLGYVLALTSWTRDFPPLDVRHAWRTNKKGRLLAETPFFHFISNGAACLSTAHHHLLRGFEIATAQFVIVQAIRRDITAVHRFLVIPFLVLILYRMYNLTRCIVECQTRTTGFR